MLQFTNKKIVDEALSRIDLYYSLKENNMLDTFYVSHLSCMQELLEKYNEALDGMLYVICAVDDNKYSTGECTPNYVTVCKKPHWEQEGLMITRGIYDATKFNIECCDIKPILKYCESKFPDKKFEVVPVDKRTLGNLPRELWSDERIRGDFDKTGKISGIFVKDVGYDD